MDKLHLLAHESADLNPGHTYGMFSLTHYGFGEWHLTVHVRNEHAHHHCEDPGAVIPVMRECGGSLDMVLDRMIARVRDAVADTPAEEVA